MKRFSILIAVITVLATACGPEAKKSPTTPATVVNVLIIQPATLADSFVAIGTVRPETMATLSARLPGNVTSVLVREGERVHRFTLN